MIDTHAHIDTEQFDEDREAVIERSREAGVEKIIIPAIEPKDFQRILDVVHKHENIFCGMGIHPHNANELNGQTRETIENLCSDDKVVAVGEIGLDYYYDFTPKDVQQKAFAEQLDIAKNHNLPVIVHNRESDEDLLQIIKEKQDGTLTGVLHCFSGDENMLKEALDLGFYISFTGNITFKKSKSDNLVAMTPSERLLLETDSPYMTPVPYRGKRNEPAFVKLVAEKIAKIKSITLNEVIKMTTRNAKELFKFALILIFIFSLTLAVPISANAQDDEYTDEYSEEEFVNPYPKGLGIGATVGTNTIVEQQYFEGNDKSISYEGIFFWGAVLNWSVLDFLMIEASYNYSKNTKIIETSNDQLGPNIHQVLELTSQWIANPSSRVNFYGTLGLSFFYNTLNERRVDLESQDNPVGFNFGLGFKVNIPIGNFMTLVPFLEWRLNWAPTKVNTWTYWDKGSTVPVQVQSTKFFSMPRLGLVFYPTALNFLNLSN